MLRKCCQAVLQLHHVALQVTRHEFVDKPILDALRTDEHERAVQAVKANWQESLKRVLAQKEPMNKETRYTKTTEGLFT